MYRNAKHGGVLPVLTQTALVHLEDKPAQLRDRGKKRLRLHFLDSGQETATSAGTDSQKDNYQQRQNHQNHESESNDSDDGEMIDACPHPADGTNANPPTSEDMHDMHDWSGDSDELYDLSSDSEPTTDSESEYYF